ncbi:MAG: hypothetical protein PHW32_01130 [Bacilli bacterium]|nr:hypothetical protein [Bacilli bacterium]MDD4282910.1 hypothetical protein [Bacilli bacterium]MDD4719106.1 hypothetical protein [Bacilli bacterium]
MANIKSEQLRSDLSLELEYDQPLSTKEMIKKLINILGKNNCETTKINNKNILIYNHDNKKEYLLLASITYMGGNGQHPIYKKRMQLKKWYKDIVILFENKKNVNVRFIGMYHYKDNIIISEIVKNTYLKKKMNSSAAHIYTNDLFQAMKEGIFKRVDRNKNKIVSIKYIKFKDYLDGKLSTQNELFTLFDIFNNNFNFGNWLPANKAIVEMYEAKWPNWKETEWPGWYLEYKFNKFILDYSIENKIKYVGSSHKKAEEFDFDLWFDEENFYGDLKASDISAREAPGNDQETFIDCINKYDKFWYVIYEHETIKDSKENNYEATRFRTNFIKNKNEWNKNKKWDELSYHKRMKNSVKFVQMSIIELNRINFRDALDDFNQGRQPSGNLRKPKFKITKNNIDNFIVFQYEFIELSE